MKLIKNSIILPLAGSMSSFTGGVVTSDGQFVKDSSLYRGRQTEPQKPVEHLSGTYIYGGCWFSHFGHFIWESLSRLYAIRQCKNYPILFISPDEKIYKPYKILLESIGIKNEIYLITVPTSIEHLIFSVPGSAIHPVYITDDQINALKYFYFVKRTEDNTPEKKIWLSRSKLLVGTVINEQAIENILKKFGYTIIYPETLSLQKQVRLISQADIVAGFDGSQFFSLLFAKEIFGKFYVFNRRPQIPDTIPYMFQKRVVEFALHTFDVEHICGENAWSYHIHSEPEKILEMLRYL